MRNIPKLLICHIVAQKDPGLIFGTQKIISNNNDSDSEEDVAGTGGADDDNDNDDGEDEVEFVDHDDDIAVPNIEMQLPISILRKRRKLMMLV